jgi:hypothetical protein
MSQFDSTDSDPSDSSPISSGQVETPRGGFMARPGLKAPPRHAVVVRGGDAPESAEIPIARSSFPPPPASFPPPESLSEKITLRAIPTPRTAAVVARAAPYAPAPAMAPSLATMAAEPTRLPVALESVPPPSDAPVVSSVEEHGSSERSSSVPRSRRLARSWLTIVAAATAGLVLGVASVFTTVHVRSGAASSPAAAGPVEGTSLAAVPETPAPPRRAESSAPGSSVGAGRQVAKPEPAAPAPPPARGAAAKRSIF